MSESQPPNYNEWTKERLIEKLQEYELNDKKRKSGQSELNLSDETSKQKKKKPKTFDFTRYEFRKIALKFAYLGWNYHGLAFQKHMNGAETVESEILKALHKTKLVSSIDPACCEFSRCGRTDKGVSAMNQVISLSVRSNLSGEEISNSKYNERELNYVKILNKVLPPDIRIHSVCLNPPKDFDARFSCTYRHYKYFFESDGLNISKMQEAASLFIGEHDFRNFCKLDGSKQITNYKRTILSSSIIPSEHGANIYVFDLRGSAFLWHQVRCMMSILFLVGRELEQKAIITELLNPALYPSRPNYKIASPFPLVLFDCKYDEKTTNWIKCTTFDGLHLLRFNQLWGDLKTKSTIISTMKNVLGNGKTESTKTINLEEGRIHNPATYVPISKRETLETADEVNEKWMLKKRG